MRTKYPVKNLHLFNSRSLDKFDRLNVIQNCLNILPHSSYFSIREVNESFHLVNPMIIRNFAFNRIVQFEEFQKLKVIFDKIERII
ncbi:MAG: hypothetical protein ACI9XO_001760 [Paraglaciecola sp.]|jgi:hypothetical protein